ncbi:MAG: tRNA lysidine(34) synthetase TilS, partial [Planctomycetales bacterium]|nr:tRNA lysidine(34) synthetase TilS [Planctomycetales bacterium]
MTRLASQVPVKPVKECLTIAHFNHRLRGQESDADEQFVVELGAKLGVSVITGSADPNQIEQSKARVGIEAAARNLRYDFLQATAEKLGARYILTAHTADDQAETVLHNICRGTGLTGLAGIPFARPISQAVTVVRPMLRVARAPVEAYLADRRCVFRDDSSNMSDSYTRNRIRHSVIPLLEQQVNSDVRQHICDLARHVTATIEELDKSACKLEAAVVSQSAAELQLDNTRLQEVSNLLLVHFLQQLWRRQSWPVRDFTVAWWERIAQSILRPAQVKCDLPGGVEFQCDATISKFSRRKKETRIKV